MIFISDSLENALLEAEKATGREKEELIYRVEEKSGIFKNKQVKLEVVGFKQKALIGIKNGNIVYKEGDILPSITPEPNVIVMVNDKIIDGKVSVKKDDNIIILPKNSDCKRNISVEISEDKFEAYLIVEYIPKCEYEISDCDMGNEIIIKAKLVKEIYPEKYTKDDIFNILNENKIICGIKMNNCESILKMGGKCTIASGTRPLEPIDDYIKYYFNIKNNKKPVEIDGKVDYYNMGEINYVNEKEILAEKIPGKDGTDGCNIFGKVTKGAKRKTINLLPGTGCFLSDDGLKILSSVKGSPSIKGDRVCVFPVITYDKDIDIKTGNIVFHGGDVVIKGNVKEGLKIESGNCVKVYGNVADSKICAAGNILIEKNVISSTIIAGNCQIEEEKLIGLLSEFAEFLDGIYKSFIDIKNSGKLKSDIPAGTIFKVLLQSKYQKIKSNIIVDFNNMKNLCKCNDEIKEILDESLKIYFQIENGYLNNPFQISNLHKKINDFLIKYEMKNTPADVYIRYSLNSNISATNNVEITGKGCYNTTIKANNIVKFTGFPGVVRGGEIFGKGGVSCKEVGSNAGALTVIKANKDSIIEADMVYHNTIFYIGDLVYRVDYPIKKVKVYNKSGEIIVEKLKYEG